MTDNNNEVFFKIKKSTKLEKLMGAFCERQGKTVNSVRFLFEGQRVQPNDTPDTVSLFPRPSLLLLPPQVCDKGRACRASSRLRTTFYSHLLLPPQLEMQDGDTLEVHQEQVGGSGLF